MALIHIHFCMFANAGDTRRVKNIDRFVASRLSDEIIEVEVFSILQFFNILFRYPRFILSNYINKKLYLPVLFSIPLFSTWFGSLIIGLICKKYRADYVIGEFSTASRVLMLVKKISPKTKIIIDVHGAVLEEKKYINPHISHKEYCYLESLENKTYELADYIICQSEEMKRYILSNYKLSSGKKITVYKCGVDTTLFNLDSVARNNKRLEIGAFNDEIVFVYSGAIQKWQKISESLRIFKNFLSQYPSSKMLILTRNTEELKILIATENFEEIKEHLIVKSLKMEEVPLYLNAADVAFLIRDDAIMNAVASPTKLGEYLACGLPIISSKVAKKWITDEANSFIIYSDLYRDLNMSINETVKTTNRKVIYDYAKKYLSIENDNINIKEMFNL